MAISILHEKPDSADCAELINELQNYLAGLYPPASQHGFSIQRLIDEQVAFFLLRYDEVPAGCGGIKIYSGYGEVKRVYVRPHFRKHGLSRRIMDHLEAYAISQGVTIVRLETGVYQPEAIGLYEHMGYQRIPPFGEYVFDPLSLYFEKSLESGS
jgi:GNAT superfamily N-acetyltransferase